MAGIGFFIAIPCLLGAYIAGAAQWMLAGRSLSAWISIPLSVSAAAVVTFAAYFVPLIVLIEPLELSRFFPTDNESVGAGMWITLFLWLPLVALPTAFVVSLRKTPK